MQLLIFLVFNGHYCCPPRRRNANLFSTPLSCALLYAYCPFDKHYDSTSFDPAADLSETFSCRGLLELNNTQLHWQSIDELLKAMNHLSNN